VRLYPFPLFSGSSKKAPKRRQDSVLSQSDILSAEEDDCLKGGICSKIQT
jgi:hypothetical protein